MINKYTIKDSNNTPGLSGIGNLLGKSPVASFNLDGIQNLIDTKGFLGFHFKSAINPNRNNTTAGLDPTNENGYSRLFYEVRPVRLVPQNMNLTDVLSRVGLAVQGTALLNLSSQYLDSPDERVHAKTGDLIVLNPTFTEIYDQLLEQPEGNLLSLHYPAREVDYITTASTVFEESVDFVITPEGRIQWQSGGRKPKTGEVVSIVYAASPIYIVNRVEHSLRILPSNPSGSGAATRQARYAPQMLLANLSNVRSEKPSFDPFTLPIVAEWEKYLLVHER